MSEGAQGTADAPGDPPAAPRPPRNGQRHGRRSRGSAAPGDHPGPPALDPGDPGRTSAHVRRRSGRSRRSRGSSSGATSDPKTAKGTGGGPGDLPAPAQPTRNARGHGGGPGDPGGPRRMDDNAQRQKETLQGILPHPHIRPETATGAVAVQGIRRAERPHWTPALGPGDPDPPPGKAPLDPRVPTERRADVGGKGNFVPRIRSLLCEGTTEPHPLAPRSALLHGGSWNRGRESWPASRNLFDIGGVTTRFDRRKKIRGGSAEA